MFQLILMPRVNSAQHSDRSGRRQVAPPAAYLAQAHFGLGDRLPLPHRLSASSRRWESSPGPSAGESPPTGMTYPYTVATGAGCTGHTRSMLPGHSQGTRRFKRHGDHRVFVVEALGIEPG